MTVGVQAATLCWQEQHRRLENGEVGESRFVGAGAVESPVQVGGARFAVCSGSAPELPLGKGQTGDGHEGFGRGEINDGIQESSFSCSSEIEDKDGGGREGEKTDEKRRHSFCTLFRRRFATVGYGSVLPQRVYTLQCHAGMQYYHRGHPWRLNPADSPEVRRMLSECSWDRVS